MKQRFENSQFQLKLLYIGQAPYGIPNMVQPIKPSSQGNVQKSLPPLKP